MTGKLSEDHRDIVECFKSGLGVFVIVSLENSREVTTRSVFLF